MFKCYCVTDGEPAYDMFLLVYQSPGRKRSFIRDYKIATRAAAAEKPSEWSRDDVLGILRNKMGWEIISPNYEVIQEENL